MRHLPVERVDLESNFIATSNINETRFHKAWGHFVRDDVLYKVVWGCVEHGQSCCRVSTGATSTILREKLLLYIGWLVSMLWQG